MTLPTKGLETMRAGEPGFETDTGPDATGISRERAHRSKVSSSLGLASMVPAGGSSRSRAYARSGPSTLKEWAA